MALADALDAIPIVANTAERATRFPAPQVGQRVQNLATGAIERWNGTWITDYVSALTVTSREKRYFAVDYGCACDGTTDDYAALNTLVNTTMAAGGVLVISGAGPRIATSLAIPSNVRLDRMQGSKWTIDTTKTLTINSQFAAPLEQTFNCVGTGVVAFAPGAVEEVYPEWFGAVGDGSTDDTTNFGKAVNAANSAVYQNTPAGGTQLGTIPAVILTRKEYVIASAMSTGAYAIFRSRNRSRLRQSTPTAVHLNLGNAHRCEVTGIQFVGGKHAIQYYNNNTELGRLLVRDCSFQLTSNFAIRVGGSGNAGGAAAFTSSTGTLAATATTFTRSDGGSFITDGFAIGQTITPSGFSNNMISTITNVTASTITVNDTRTVEVSAAGRGLEGTYALDTNSSNVLVENCEFYKCHSLWSATCDQFTAKDCWLSVHQDTTPANVPQIVNLCFGMELENFFGVPPGTGTPAALRWVDNYRRIQIKGLSRFGGENGGIAGIWHRGAPSASGGNAQGTAVEMYGGYATGGAANPTSGLVIFRENIPELLVIEGVRGLGGTGVVIEAPASVYAANISTSTYLAAFGVSLFERFRGRVDANLMASPTAVPAAYKQILAHRRDQLLWDPWWSGSRTLVDNVAAALLDVTLDSGGGNDDSASFMINYEVEDLAGGAVRSNESGIVSFVVARNTSPASVGAVSKIGFAQIMSGGITMTVTFTAVVVGSVVTLKATADTSNGDGTTIIFRARQMKALTRGGSSVALASGVTWHEGGI